jgi:putative hemolysin
MWTAALDRLDVTLDVSPADVAAVCPSEGPVVVVANHPYGVLDGLALCRLITQVRPDFRLLVNRVLCRDARAERYFLPINFSESGAAQRQNVRSIKAALSHLQEGGTLGLFPAGGVATAPHPFGTARDLSWKPLLATLIHTAEAPVLPVHFAGQNSRLFQIVSQVSLTLRLALLMREALCQQGTTLPVHLGEPLPYADLAALADRTALVQRLRHATLRLAPESS